MRRPQTEDLRPQHTDSDTVLRDSVSESQCGASRRHRHEPASMCAGDSRSLSSGRVVLQHRLWRARVSSEDYPRRRVLSTLRPEALISAIAQRPMHDATHHTRLDHGFFQPARTARHSDAVRATPGRARPDHSLRQRRACPAKMRGTTRRVANRSASYRAARVRPRGPSIEEVTGAASPPGSSALRRGASARASG